MANNVRQAPGRCRLIEEDLEKVIGNVLGKSGQSIESLKECRDKDVRNGLIRQLKETTDLSVHELSRLMGVRVT